MKIVEISIKNYRSITEANKLKIGKYTVLVGKNNEGKSNILSAINVAMNSIIVHTKDYNPIRLRYERKYYSNRLWDGWYLWERDFPIELQNRKRGTDSIFKVTFQLEGDEIEEFHKSTNIKGNADIPIEIKIGKDNKPYISFLKQGTKKYNEKSSVVTKFISERISFNYIPTVRTEKEATQALDEAIQRRLRVLKKNEEYNKAVETIRRLQQDVLDEISQKLNDPIKIFLPRLESINIKNIDDHRLYGGSNIDFDIIMNDGVETSINYKGDGIKSLVSIAILKNMKETGGASLIAIEEPESHLHSGAIHSLADILKDMSENNQVIITTHNPLFVQQNNINNNIIVDNNKALPAKNIKIIRETLGVRPSDNLMNARYVLIVEGESDKKILYKLLKSMSKKIEKSLNTNQLLIKPLNGASRLYHEVQELKNCMCKYLAVLDNDREAKDAIYKAINDKIVDEKELRRTLFNEKKEAELEDGIRPEIYVDVIKEEYGVDLLKDNGFRNKTNKWSKRIEKVFVKNGIEFSNEIKNAVKNIVHDKIFECDDINIAFTEEGKTFLKNIVLYLEKMMEDDT